jgi:hypothetical protein
MGEKNIVNGRKLELREELDRYGRMGPELVSLAKGKEFDLTARVEEIENELNSGWAYVLKNESMPNKFKIGKTKLDPHQRAKQLCTTGVPSPFEVVYAFRHKDYEKIERSC